MCLALVGFWVCWLVPVIIAVCCCFAFGSGLFDCALFVVCVSLGAGDCLAFGVNLCLGLC